MDQREQIILALHGLENEKLLRIEDVAVEIQRSIFTINNWYRFKRQNPDNRYAKLLPDFIQLEGERQTRYWKKSDIPRMLEFRDALPRGNSGVMGDVTQKYYRRKKQAEDDKRQDEV